MSETTSTPKYKILYNRLTGGVPFAASTAVDRITALADALEITQEEADELLAIARQNGTEGATVEERLTALETRAMEQDEALMELAEMLAETEGGADHG